MKKTIIILAMSLFSIAGFASPNAKSNFSTTKIEKAIISQVVKYSISYSKNVERCTVTVTKGKVIATFTADDCETALNAAALFVKLVKL